MQRRVWFVALAALAIASCGDGGAAAPATTPPSTAATAPTGSVRPTGPAAPTTAAGATTRPAPTLAPVTTVAPTTAPRLDLRRVDWLATLRGIDLFKIDTAGSGATDRRPTVELTSASLSGYALLDDIAYGDLSGDGSDEAVITLFSGGTAGNTGLLIFNTGASGKVELTGPIEFYRGFGYKTGGVIRDSALTVTNVAAAGWEPNCCQSGLVTRRFKIVNGLLAQQGATLEEGVPSARALTIEHFYSLIDRKQLDEAYTHLSPTYQAANPIGAWKAGFATTKSVTATSEATDAPGPVKFRLDAVDTTPSGDLRRTFTGIWTLVYSTAKHQWLLDRAEVQLGG